MKYFIAIALIAAVASAGVHRPAPSSEIEQIVAAINSPSTDPATAVALEAMLHDLLGTSPIAVGPAIVDPIAVHPIAVGPAIVEPIAVHPISVGPAIVEPIGNPVDVIAVNPMPVAEPVAPVAEAASSPLVQIIVNVQKAEDIATGPAVVPVPAPVVEQVVAPVSVAEEVYVPGPVNVVDNVDITPVEPVQVVTPVVVQPIQIGTPVLPSPVQVATPVLPVQVATPIIPEQAINPIDTLN